MKRGIKLTMMVTQGLHVRERLGADRVDSEIQAERSLDSSRIYLHHRRAWSSRSAIHDVRAQLPNLQDIGFLPWQAVSKRLVSTLKSKQHQPDMKNAFGKSQRLYCTSLQTNVSALRSAFLRLRGAQYTSHVDPGAIERC
jgi:hypothetical protein